MRPFFTDKRFVISALLLLMTIVTIAVAFLTRPQEPDVSISNTDTREAFSVQVQYGDYSKNYTDVEKKVIQEKFEWIISNAVTKPSTTYVIAARAGTYSSTLYENTTPIRELVFDIQKLPSSYVIRFDGSEQGEFNILSFRCADEQINPSIPCKVVIDE